MFHIKTQLKKSPIHGIGLFANENILKGRLVYTENQSLDLLLSKKEFLKISPDEKETVRHYGYFDRSKSKWHLAMDDIRFCNHSLDGNITLSNGVLIAKRDIKKGEEITQNYEEIEKLREELIKK